MDISIKSIIENVISGLIGTFIVGFIGFIIKLFFPSQDITTIMIFILLFLIIATIIFAWKMSKIYRIGLSSLISNPTYEHLNQAKEYIKIFAISAKGLSISFSYIESALKRGVYIKILISEPNNNCVLWRQEQDNKFENVLNNNVIQDECNTTINKYKTLKSRYPTLIELKTYNSLAYYSSTITDNDLYYAPYFVTHPSNQESLLFEIKRDSRLSKQIREDFDLYWGKSQLIS